MTDATGALPKSEVPRARRAAVTFVPHTFEDLGALWQAPGTGLSWHCLFVLPWWLQTWWNVYGGDGKPWIRVGRASGETLGVAPLLVRGTTASFLGSEDVCDYGDFVVASGREEAFFGGLLEELRTEGVEALDLGSVRADAVALAGLRAAAQCRGLPVSIEETGVSYETALPSTWEAYLDRLDKKQRHEIRRKFRRLREGARRVEYRRVGDAPGSPEIETFLKLFRVSRMDKAAFLTPQAEAFFRSLMARAAREQALHLAFLDLDGEPAACVLCFELGDTLYLYNNGYDAERRDLSVGLLSKVAAIREAIRLGKERFDFLKGSEPYKHRLGGVGTPLFRCRVELG